MNQGDLVAFGIIAAATAATVWFAIVQAAKHNAPAMLVVIILAVIALVSLAASLLASDQGELVTIAATAVGALAGALNSLVRPRTDLERPRTPDTPEDDHQDRTAGNGD